MSITVPVLNGIAKNSGIFQFDTNKSYVTISTIADQNLTLTLYQSFDNGGNFDYSDSHNIIANVDVTHIFPKRGTTCYFSLENNSGTNCTFTRSYSDQVDNVNNDNSGDKQDVSDSITHTKLDGVKTSVDNLADATLNVSGTVNIGSTVNIGNAVLDVSDTFSHTKLDTVKTSVDTVNTTLNGTLDVTGSSVSVSNTVQVANTDLGFLSDINTKLGATLTTTDATTHTNLGTINTTLSGTLDVCPVLCRPLLVATIFNTTSGTTAVNVIDGALKLVGFSYAHSDSQGCLSFYDVAAASTAPTFASTALFSVAATSSVLSSPTFPTSSYINFENGLWIRINGNIDPGNNTNEAGTITLYYER